MPTPPHTHATAYSRHRTPASPHAYTPASVQPPTHTRSWRHRPPRESSRLHDRLLSCHSRCKRLGSAATSLLHVAAQPPPAPDNAGRPPPAASAEDHYALESQTRGAFLEFFASLLRDLDRFVPDLAVARHLAAPSAAEAGGDVAVAGGDGVAGGAEEDTMPEEELEARLEAFVESQPAPSHKFLRELLRTQMFLCFVQPPMHPPEQSDTADAQPSLAPRGGRCYALARDEFLRRQLKLVSDHDDETHRREATELLSIPADAMGGSYTTVHKQEVGASGGDVLIAAQEATRKERLVQVLPPIAQCRSQLQAQPQPQPHDTRISP